MNGIINLYKPSGITSFAAVAKVKRILGVKTVGHMGTLDPMAEGVLVIGVGKCARLFDYLSGRKKTYIAKFKFGYSTDTLDALGTVTEVTSDIPSVDAALHAMQSLVGESEQIPPQYSAKHVAGKRAYDLARNGIQAELKPNRITIYDVQLICQPAMDEMVFQIICSAGTYIRSVCRDVAKMCGSLATLTYLKRTASGIFSSDNAVTIGELERLKEKALILPQDVLELPVYEVPAEHYDDLVFGRKIPCDVATDSLIYGNGELFGIGKTVNGILKIKTYLRDNH